MADTYLKRLARLSYLDPIPILLRYGELEIQVAQSNLRPDVKALRTSKLKTAREGREAALFALGLAEVTRTKVYVALDESADHDFVLCWSQEEPVRFCPVQLKELVSAERNPTASMEGLISSVASRPRTQTILLIRLNRKADIHIETLPLDGFPFSELWFLWQVAPDPSRWAILGNGLATPVRYDFDYPVP